MDRDGGLCLACGLRPDDEPEHYRRALWVALRALEDRLGVLRWEITAPEKRARIGEEIVRSKEHAIELEEAHATTIRDRLRALQGL